MANPVSIPMASERALSTQLMTSRRWQKPRRSDGRQPGRPAHAVRDLAKDGHVGLPHHLAANGGGSRCVTLN